MVPNVQPFVLHNTKMRASASVASAKSVWEGQTGWAATLRLSRILTLAYRPLRQGLLNKLKGSRSFNNDCEYSDCITLPEPHSVSQVFASCSSVQLGKICRKNKVLGWEEKKSSWASVQSYSTITHLLEHIKHFAQILSVEGRRG